MRVFDDQVAIVAEVFRGCSGTAAQFRFQPLECFQAFCHAVQFTGEGPGDIPKRRGIREGQVLEQGQVTCVGFSDLAHRVLNPQAVGKLVPGLQAGLAQGPFVGGGVRVQSD